MPRTERREDNVTMDGGIREMKCQDGVAAGGTVLHCATLQYCTVLYVLYPEPVYRQKPMLWYPKTGYCTAMYVLYTEPVF